MKLFIIGNGFDRAHGMKTGYPDFRAYLEDNLCEFLNTFENAYVNYATNETMEDFLWEKFELSLSDIDEDRFLDQILDLNLCLEGVEIGIEDMLSEYYRSQYEYIKNLNKYLLDWIKSIEMPTERIINTIEYEIIDGEKYTEDIFLTFNYTMVLEDLYEIDNNNICHIHNSVDDGEVIFGHGNYDKYNQALIRNVESKRVCDEDHDESLSIMIEEYFSEKELAIYGVLKEYYEITEKDVKNNITKLDSLNGISHVDEIVVIGHSIGEVDMPYLKKIVNDNKGRACWKLVDICFKGKIEKLIQLGIENHKIELVYSDEYCIKKIESL